MKCIDDVYIELTDNKDASYCLLTDGSVELKMLFDFLNSFKFIVESGATVMNHDLGADLMVGDSRHDCALYNEHDVYKLLMEINPRYDYLLFYSDIERNLCGAFKAENGVYRPIELVCDEGIAPLKFGSNTYTIPGNDHGVSFEECMRFVLTYKDAKIADMVASSNFNLSVEYVREHCKGYLA